MQIEYRAADDLRANEYNPNRQSATEFALLKKSIAEDGMTQPIVALPSGVIIDGEHRWRACKELNIDPVPVVVVALDEARRRIATIRHNTARGSHDMEREADVLRAIVDLAGEGAALDGLQLTSAELDAALSLPSAADLYGGSEFGQAWTPQRSVEHDELSAAAHHASRTVRKSLIFADHEFAAIERRAAAERTTVVDLISEAISATGSRSDAPGICPHCGR